MALITEDEIIKKLGIESLDYETQKQILENVAGVVSKAIWRKISEMLGESDLDELQKLMDEGNEGGVEWYLKSKFPNYDDFAAATEIEVIDQIAADKKQFDMAVAKATESNPATR